MSDKLFGYIRNIAMRLGISSPESDGDIYNPSLFRLIDKQIQHLLIELGESNAKTKAKDSRIAELEEALMNIKEYATHVTLHFSSDNKKHRDHHIQHFVNQILEHCKAKGGE